MNKEAEDLAKAIRYALAVLQEHLSIRRGESVTYVPEWELTEAVRTMASLLAALDANETIVAEARKALTASRRQTAQPETA